MVRHRRCLRFAVAITDAHARLAFGCWPDSAEWDWLPTGFQREVSGNVMFPILLPQVKQDTIAELARVRESWRRPKCCHFGYTLILKVDKALVLGSMLHFGDPVARIHDPSLLGS